MSNSWLQDASNSNIFKQSYMKGFLDVSGDVYIRNGNLIATNDISLNGNVSCNALSLTVPFSSSGINPDVSGALALKQNTLIAGSGITFDGTTINAASAGGGISKISSVVFKESSVDNNLIGSTNAGYSQSYGWDIDINNDGDSMIVSQIMYTHQATGIVQAGRAIVYTYNGNNWVQKGNDVIGTINNEKLGFSVAMNGDGNTIAITSFIREKIFIYEWSGTEWIQKGNEISFPKALSGLSISLNNTGDRIITSYFIQTSVVISGIVYEYNNGTSTWVQLGSDFGNEPYHNGTIYGRLVHRHHHMSMSGDGSRVVYAYSPHGKVHIYDYNSGTSSWDSIGTISATASTLFGYATRISKDGSTIVITAPLNGTNKEGLAQVYSYNGDGTWSSKGSQLVGDDSNDNFGLDCAINNDGTVIVVSSGKYNDFNTKQSYVKYYIFENNDWVLKETRFSVSNNEKMGLSLCINDSGSIYIASSPYGYYKESGNYNSLGFGVVNIYTPKDILSITINSATNVSGNLSVTGNLSADGVVLHTSDDRLKDNEQRIENALETLDKLKPVKYIKNNKTETGFIAQDVWYNAPEIKYLVNTDTSNIIDISGSYTHETDLSTHGWSNEPAQLNYIGLMGHITKGIQELDSLIESNKTKINSIS